MSGELGANFLKSLLDEAARLLMILRSWMIYTVQKESSIVGLRLKKELSGLIYLDLEETERKKAIATTLSFAKDEYSYENICGRISTYATRCAEKLRKDNLAAARLKFS